MISLAPRQPLPMVQSRQRLPTTVRFGVLPPSARPRERGSGAWAAPSGRASPQTALHLGGDVGVVVDDPPRSGLAPVDVGHANLPPHRVSGERRVNTLGAQLVGRVTD